MAVKYKRAFLKLSGEALAKKDPATGEQKEMFDVEVLDRITSVIKECTELGCGFGIMIGGGNIWRGRQGLAMDRVRADHMGMLATTINALAFADAMEKVLTAYEEKQKALNLDKSSEKYSYNSSGKITYYKNNEGVEFFFSYDKLGNVVTMTLFGESHGKTIGATLDGILPGILVNEDFIKLNESVNFSF